MKIVFDIVYSLRTLQSFMEACDMTDRGKKQFSQTYTLTFEMEEGTEVTKEGVDEMMSETKKSIEQNKGNVVFIGFRSLRIQSIYIKEGIQTISNGQGWCLFKDLLEKLGYEVTTTKNMEVTSAKFILQPDIHM